MTQPANDTELKSHEEQAAEWCWRIAEGALSDSAQKDFDAWLGADLGHREAFEEMVAVWQGTDAIAEMPGFLSLRAKALTTMERARGHSDLQRAPQRWYRVAAISIAMLMTVVAGAWFVSQRPLIYRTEIGERRVVRLADGSQVSMDASSVIAVTYSRDRRMLELERGRAKFDVAKDPLRPFIVTAGQKTVVATGTAFSVELLQRQVRVLLYEGHVAVLARPKNGDSLTPVKIADGTGKEQNLVPGEELVANVSSHSAVVARADIEHSLSWEAGRLSFIDEPLSSAIERVNRYADAPIVIGDAAAGRYIINGVFDAGDIRGFVSGVVSLYPIEARYEAGRIALVSRAHSAR